MGMTIHVDASGWDRTTLRYPNQPANKVYASAMARLGPYEARNSFSDSDNEDEGRHHPVDYGTPPKPRGPKLALRKLQAGKIKQSVGEEMARSSITHIAAARKDKDRRMKQRGQARVFKQLDVTLEVLGLTEASDVLAQSSPGGSLYPSESVASEGMASVRSESVPRRRPTLRHLNSSEATLPALVAAPYPAAVVPSTAGLAYASGRQAAPHQACDTGERDAAPARVQSASVRATKSFASALLAQPAAQTAAIIHPSSSQPARRSFATGTSTARPKSISVAMPAPDSRRRFSASGRSGQLGQVQRAVSARAPSLGSKLSLAAAINDTAKKDFFSNLSPVQDEVQVADEDANDEFQGLRNQAEMLKNRVQGQRRTSPLSQPSVLKHWWQQIEDFIKVIGEQQKEVKSLLRELEPHRGERESSCQKVRLLIVPELAKLLEDGAAPFRGLLERLKSTPPLAISAHDIEHATMLAEKLVDKAVAISRESLRCEVEEPGELMDLDTSLANSVAEVVICTVKMSSHLASELFQKGSLRAGASVHETSARSEALKSEALKVTSAKSEALKVTSAKSEALKVRDQFWFCDPTSAKSEALKVTSAKSEALKVAWRRSSRICKKVRRHWPALNISLLTEACLCMLTGANLASAMQQDDADDGDEKLSSSHSSLVSGSGAWGASANGFPFSGTSSPELIKDEDVQTHAWIPSLLEALLTGAIDAHSSLRIELERLEALLTGAMGAHSSLRDELVKEESDLSEEEENFLYALLDEMQRAFCELALANTQRTARLCSSPTSLSYWALETLEEQAKKAVFFLLAYDKCSLGLNDLMEEGQDPDGRFKVLFHSVSEAATCVVNGFLSIKQQLKVRRPVEEDQAHPSLEPWITPSSSRTAAVQRLTQPTSQRPPTQALASCSIYADTQQGKPPNRESRSIVQATDRPKSSARQVESSRSGAPQYIRLTELESCALSSGSGSYASSTEGSLKGNSEPPSMLLTDLLSEAVPADQKEDFAGFWEWLSSGQSEDSSDSPLVQLSLSCGSASVPVPEALEPAGLQSGPLPLPQPQPPILASDAKASERHQPPILPSHVNIAERPSPPYTKLSYAAIAAASASTPGTHYAAIAAASAAHYASIAAASASTPGTHYASIATASALTPGTHYASIAAASASTSAAHYASIAAASASTSAARYAAIAAASASTPGTYYAAIAAASASTSAARYAAIAAASASTPGTHYAAIAATSGSSPATNYASIAAASASLPTTHTLHSKSVGPSSVAPPKATRASASGKGRRVQSPGAVVDGAAVHSTTTAPPHHHHTTCFIPHRHHTAVADGAAVYPETHTATFQPGVRISDPVSARLSVHSSEAQSPSFQAHSSSSGDWGFPQQNPLFRKVDSAGRRSHESVQPDVMNLVKQLPAVRATPHPASGQAIGISTLTDAAARETAGHPPPPARASLVPAATADEPTSSVPKAPASSTTRAKSPFMAYNFLMIDTDSNISSNGNSSATRVDNGEAGERPQREDATEASPHGDTSGVPLAPSTDGAATGGKAQVQASKRLRCSLDSSRPPTKPRSIPRLNGSPNACPPEGSEILVTPRSADSRGAHLNIRSIGAPPMSASHPGASASPAPPAPAAVTPESQALSPFAKYANEVPSGTLPSFNGYLGGGRNPSAATVSPPHHTRAASSTQQACSAAGVAVARPTAVAAGTPAGLPRVPGVHISWSKLQPGITQQIGQGGYGQECNNSNSCSSKRVTWSSINQCLITPKRSEVEFQQLMSHHPNIVHYRGACCEYVEPKDACSLPSGELSLQLSSASSGRRPMLAIVMEYCKMGSVFGLVSQARLDKKRALGKTPKQLEALRGSFGYRFYRDWEKRLEVLAGAAAGTVLR
eukprot:gene9776-7659_t